MRPAVDFETPELSSRRHYEGAKGVAKTNEPTGVIRDLPKENAPEEETVDPLARWRNSTQLLAAFSPQTHTIT